jgi:hypothetical protein
MPVLLSSIVAPEFSNGCSGIRPRDEIRHLLRQPPWRRRVGQTKCTSCDGG